MGARAFRAISIAIVLAVATGAPREALAQGWEPNPQEQPPEETAPVDQASPEPASTIPLHFEMGPEGDYVTPPIRGGTNPFGVGFGGRAALTISDFYLGARVVDFLGGTDIDISYRSLLAGIELGYDFRVRLQPNMFLSFRPQVGVGDAVVYYTDPALAKVDVVSTASGRSSSSSSDTLSVNSIYLDPGATVSLTSGITYVSLSESILLLPGITYGGADPATWLCYGTRVSVGLRY